MSVNLEVSCKTCKYFIRGMKYCSRQQRVINNTNNPPCGGAFFSPKTSGKIVSDNASNSVLPITHNTPRPTITTPLPNLSTSRSPVLPLYDRLLGISLTKYAPTGISKLDEVLKGGFLRGKTYLIAGETGAGKTIFSLQFLVYGASQLNESGIYLAIDEPAEHVIKGLKSLGWDVRDLIEEGKLLFLDMRTHFSKLYLKDEKRRIEPHILIDSIIKNIRKLNAKRLVIDPIAPLMYGTKEEDILYTREFLREMVFSLERLEDVTTIMTSEIPTGSNKVSRFGVEEFLATGIIVLGFKDIRGRVYRTMYVRKARWCPVSPVKLVFDIVEGKGIVIKGYYEDILRAEEGD